MIAAVLAVGLTSAVLAGQETAKAEKEDFTANVVLTAAGPATGRTGRLIMTVERWTTDEERAQLFQALQDGGSDALLKAMRKMNVGYVRTTNTLRYRLNIATSVQTEKGRRIRLVTERPILWAEVSGMSPRSRDYEFGIIEFTLDENGKGEGDVIPTAKVTINKDGQIEVETLGIGPQKILNVKKD